MLNDTSPLAAAARDLAASYVTIAFAISAPADGAALAQTGGAGSAAQFPALAHIRRPLQSAELYEGCLIEAAIKLALDDNPRYQVLGKSVVPITDADRALVERNLHRDLSDVNPPAAGEALGRVEIDIIAVDTVDGALVLADIKRAPIPGDQTGSRFAQACLAARRSASREGLRFAKVRPLRVRWFAPGRRLPTDIITRETIDGALCVPVRDVVDHAVSAYRAAFAPRFRALLDGASLRTSQPTAVAQAAPPAASTSVHVFDRGALQRAFGCGGRFGEGRVMASFPFVRTTGPIEEPAFALWRSDDPIRLAAGGSGLRALRDAVAQVRPLAIAVAQAHVVEPLALIGSANEAGPKRQGRVRDCLATDILATALLIEAVAGNPAARRCIAHLRRQRRVPAIAWPATAPCRATDDVAAVPSF